ncbi:MAG: Uma2 family endonuclease [Cyanobacteria bacterium SBC]|nr:Uma2 family endonuclease [Cyanobacteria bacterium SBC]
MRIQRGGQQQDFVESREESLVLSGITWQQFKSLESSFAPIAGVRLVYLDGVLQIAILGDEHEYYKRTISLLLEAYLRSQGIRFYSQGSATLGDEGRGVQKEPDESYSFGSRKAIPDLAIEVVMSSGGIDSLEIYGRLGIQEVWFWEDGLLTVHSWQGEYRRVERSGLLPDLDLDLLRKYIVYHDQYDAVNDFLGELSG